MSSLWLVPRIAEIVWPLYAFAVATIGFVAWDRRTTHDIDDPPLRWLVALLAMPVVSTSWASLTSGAEYHASEIGWASSVLIALTLVVLLAVSIGVGLLVAHLPHWSGMF